MVKQRRQLLEVEEPISEFPASEAKRLKACIIDGLFLWGSSTVNDLSCSSFEIDSMRSHCDHTAEN